MPPKREQSITIRFSDEEAFTLRSRAGEWDMEVSEVIRACIALGLPVLTDVEFVRRVRLEDNQRVKAMQ